MLVERPAAFRSLLPTSAAVAIGAPVVTSPARGHTHSDFRNATHSVKHQQGSPPHGGGGGGAVGGGECAYLESLIEMLALENEIR